jgi:predicted TPR repeat methyltransferase
MASSKEGLGISDISNLLDSNEMIDKLLDSDDSEFSDTNESSDVDFIEQEDDAVLLDIGENIVMGDTACVIDSGFLWEDVDNYAEQREIFSGIGGPQDSGLIL